MSNLFNNPDNLVDMVRQVLSGKPIEEKKEELDPVNKKAVKKKFDDRKDKDIDNDGDVDSTDKYLHKRRKAISKEINEEEPCPKCGKVHINASHCMEEVELEEAVLAGRDYKVKDGKVHISKANFKKISKDYKNDTRGKERMVVLDPKTQATVSMPVVFEETELDEKAPKKKINASHCEEVELDEAGGSAFGGTIDKIQKVVDDKQAMKIDGVMVDTFTASLIMKIWNRVNKQNQDKMSKMKVTQLAKAAYKVAGMKEEVELDEAKDEDSDGEKMTDAQKKDMDGDGEKDKGEKKKKKKKDGEDDEPKADKINTEPETDEVKTMMSEDEMTPAQKTRLDKMKKKYEGGEMHKAMKAKYGDKADDVFYGKLTKMAMGEAVEMNEQIVIKQKVQEANDEEKDTNLIMQLRKAVSLRGNKVKFADGKSVVVSDKDAQKFMSMFSKLKKPAEKEMMMKSAAKSPKHFKMALSGRVEKPKSGGLDLPKMKSEK